MKEQKIKTIIDTYIEKWVEIGLNKLPGQIETEMADPDQDKKEVWQTWLPIESKVTDDEIQVFERQIGNKLPGDYKTFLKYKHFYELQISEISFFKHPVNTWAIELKKMIFQGYPTEYLVEKGYIPFANWSDWGMICFDTNRNKIENDYPIVLWDHEIADKVQDVYLNFYDFITRIDLEAQKNLH